MNVKFSDKVGTVVVIWHERFLSPLFFVFFSFSSLGPCGKRWLFAHVASVSQIWLNYNPLPQRSRSPSFCKCSKKKIKQMQTGSAFFSHEHFMYGKIQKHESTPRHHNSSRPFADEAHAISLKAPDQHEVDLEVSSVARHLKHTRFPKKKV